ncbi:MAG: hypothetical protein WAZ34_17470 [Rhodocyclaceae bacterium]
MMSHQKLHYPIENPGDLTREGITLFKQMTIAMAEASQSFHLHQIEAFQAALAENSRQFKSQLKETGDTCSALEQWSGLFQSRMQQCGKIGGTWIEHTSQTISRMSELLASPLDASAASAVNSDEPVERRVSATVITFPERRASEVVKSASGSSRMAPKRHSA